MIIPAKFGSNWMSIFREFLNYYSNKMEMDMSCLTYGQQDLNNSIDMKTEGKLKSWMTKNNLEKGGRERHIRDE